MKGAARWSTGVPPPELGFPSRARSVAKLRTVDTGDVGSLMIFFSGTSFSLGPAPWSARSGYSRVSVGRTPRPGRPGVNGEGV